MPTKFLESLGGKLAERWLSTILTPAFIFWMGGCGVYLLRGYNLLAKDPLLKIIQDELSNIVKFLIKPENQPLQIPILIISLLLVLMSGIIVNRFQFTVIRILEGYWISPFKWIQSFCCQYQQKRKDKFNNKFQELSQSSEPESKEELIKLDLILHYFPVNQIMPTQLGNILSSAEQRPQLYYGLDPFICFPRLWLLLPDNVKSELTEARNTLNMGASLWLWSVLFILWGFIAWWAILIGIILAYFSYQWMLNCAKIYGDLLESAFDLYRFELYKALCFPLPTSPQDEKEKGQQITNYLWKRPLPFITFKYPDS